MIDLLLGVPGKLKSVYDYLTTYLSSTRCAKIDNLNVAVDTRAPASTALSNATWTSALATLLGTLAPVKSDLTVIAANFPTNIVQSATANGAIGYPNTLLSTYSTSYVDVLSISGKGFINGIAIFAYSVSGAYTVNANLIVDGITLYSAASLTSNGVGHAPIGVLVGGLEGNSTNPPLVAVLNSMRIPFNSSVVLQLKTSNFMINAFAYYNIQRTS